jgi:hypothetical protein
MKILIQHNRGAPSLLEEGYASERELQEFLRDFSTLIPMDEIELGAPPLLCIGFEVGAGGGSQDLLYVDETGLLTIAETKLKKNPELRREVIGQVLEYASYAHEWTARDIESLAGKFFSSNHCPPEYQGLTLESALRKFLETTGSPAAETLSYEQFLLQMRETLDRGRIRLIIAVDEPVGHLLKTVEFINRFSQRFDILSLSIETIPRHSNQRKYFRSGHVWARWGDSEYSTREG